MNARLGNGTTNSIELTMKVRVRVLKGEVYRAVTITTTGFERHSPPPKDRDE